MNNETQNRIRDVIAAMKNKPVAVKLEARCRLRKTIYDYFIDRNWYAFGDGDADLAMDYYNSPKRREQRELNLIMQKVVWDHEPNLPHNP